MSSYLLWSNVSKSKTKKDVPSEDRRTAPRMEPYQRQHRDWRNLLLEDEWSDGEDEQRSED